MDKITERDIDTLMRILEYCERISASLMRFGNKFEDFKADYDYQDVIYMNLFQIGEAANGLSDVCIEKYRHIPWHQMYGLRNVIAHGYISLKKEDVWDTVKIDIPKLEADIQAILSDVLE